MAKTVKLHGGPWHGRIVVVEDGLTTLRIAKPLGPPTVVTDPSEELKHDIRKGTYSLVPYYISSEAATHFEWDGWEKQ